MRIDWLNLIAVLGTIATFVGLFFAIISARRAERKKFLIYNVASSLPLATVIPDQSEHRLSIVYEREGEPPLNVKGAYLSFIQLGNLGREPIRREDIAPSDALRLEVTRAKVLDLAIAGVSRDVVNFGVSQFRENRDNITTSLITFDFLDFRDGAIIRILTDNPHARVRVLGTIIGMPEGIYQAQELGKKRVLNAIGCGLAILLQVSAITGALYLFRTATGGWSLLWISLLPIGALFLPGILVAIAASTIWPKGPQWPKTLKLPEWFLSMHSLGLGRDYYYEYELKQRRLQERPSEAAEESISRFGHGIDPGE